VTKGDREGGDDVSTLETLKGIAALVKKIGDIELNSKIIDLQSEVYELLEENHKLRQEIESLKNEKEIENNLTVKGHFYFRKNENSEDGPFCTSCWDNSKKLIRVHVSDSYGVEIASCPVCKFSSSYI
jgi:hypothetical protein